MTAPVLANWATSNSKTAGTTLTLQTFSAAYGVGDVLVAHLAMDPATGPVTFSAPILGTWTAWTTEQDIAQGSGTSGVRSIVAWCVSLAAISGNPNVPVTHPSVTARAGRVLQVTGADSTTPVRGSSSFATATFGSPTTTAAAGATFDGMWLLIPGFEAATGGSVTYSVPSGWTAGSSSVMAGTSGGAAATNISTSFQTASLAGVAGGTAVTGGFTAPSGNAALVALILQNPQAAAASILPQQTQHRFPARFTRLTPARAGTVYAR